MLFFSIASGLFSFLLESGFKISTAMAMEIEKLNQEGRVNVLGNKQPKYTHEKAVTKVKQTLQTMQAREQDFADTFQTFIDKFSDSKTSHKEKMDIIDPFWSDLDKRQKPPQSITGAARLKDIANHRKAAELITKEEFQKQLTRSQNAIQGFGKLIELCDKYINTKDHEVITGLLDSLLTSHLLNLKPTIDAYMPSSNATAYSHVSLKQNEIDTYYTQDSRLAALSQIYYIVDYVRPIDILIKAGLQPTTLEWGFAEKLQQYVKGEATLDDPSAFLIDGYLYQKGIEKNPTSQLIIQLMTQLNETTNTGGVLDMAIEPAPLLPDEKEKAIEYYNVLHKIHRSRVESYISDVKSDKNKLEKIRKSAEFLNTALRSKSEYALALPEGEIKGLENKQPPKKKKKRNKKSKSHQQQTSLQTRMQPLLPKTEDTTIADEKTIDTMTEVNALGSKLTPLPAQESKTIQPLPLPKISEETIVEPKQVLETQPSIIEPKIFPNQASPQRKSTTLALPASMKQTPLQQRQQRTLTQKKGKHWEILDALCDPTTKPFTISYIEAINAMSKIGITELSPKGGGDFRKLVRHASDGKAILGRIAAYRPATSTLGRELTKIYREFIKAQLAALTLVDDKIVGK